ncbi:MULTISPECIES: chlorophyll a/b-binding protein [Prochlorococcus]|uniref:chlorophyll a/b-binding protein n=1 Tax=Prochlorococcus TaxID=1218 RepID=UPI000533B724|nr:MULTISPECIES: chlorophyll a/b-binding protein [Prochlorococcus]KGG12180.1 putative high light inducible protein [Prochlorococcus sp. MIT 0601]
MTSSTQITTESGNRQNVFPVEAKPELIESYTNYAEEAEKANGRWAMIGFLALLGAYITTGQIIPGIF